MSLSLGRGVDAREIAAEFVSHDYFEVLGARPAAGRWFGPDEENPAALSPVAVISHGLWRNRFGAEPEILGRTAWIANAAYTVIGVAPRGFTGAYAAPIDVWLPFSNNPLMGGAEGLIGRRARSIEIVARIARGATRERAIAEASAALAGTLEVPEGAGAPNSTPPRLAR